MCVYVRVCACRCVGVWVCARAYAHAPGSVRACVCPLYYHNYVLAYKLPVGLSPTVFILSYMLFHCSSHGSLLNFSCI